MLDRDTTYFSVERVGKTNLHPLFLFKKTDNKKHNQYKIAKH